MNQRSVNSPRSPVRFLPTPRDRSILEAIATHGRMTRSQIQRLFFRHYGGRLASNQAVNARLRKLAIAGLVDPVVVTGGRGAGPYAYGLTLRSRAALGIVFGARVRSVGPVLHQLDISELRVNVQEALEREGGVLAEWIGEPMLRGLLSARRGWPIPDALVHWRLPGSEGSFLLEWDRGTEPLAAVTAKLVRYENYWRGGGHRELLPGLGLRPRLALVLVSSATTQRLVSWVKQRSTGPRSTLLIAVAEDAFRDPLGEIWWRSDTREVGLLVA